MDQSLLISLAGTGLVVVLLIVLIMRKPSSGGISQAQYEDLKAERDELDEERRGLEEARASLQAENASLKTRLEAEEKAHKDKLQAIEDKFKLAAAEVIKTSGEAFHQQGAKNLQHLLDPLKKQLDELKRSVTDDAKDREGKSKSLETLIQTMKADSARLSEEADKLTKALTTSSKSRGDWGEMILETILQGAGLRPGHEYELQSSERDEDGRLLRTDVLVHMPQGQKLVIDSKVSLTAFSEFANAEEDTFQQRALKSHLAAMRTHLKDLGSKDYSRQYEGVDFVIMFVPIEGAAQTALSEDPDLTTDAVREGVMLATPTTLMMAMRTIHNLWSIDRQNRNAQEIADEAGKLYDKFVGFVEDIDKVGSQLGTVQKTYEAARNKLTDGSGNLVRRAEKLKALGARARKALPEAYSDESDEPPAIEDKTENSTYGDR